MERDAEGLLLTGHRPGRYDLWIDLPGFAPLTLPDQPLDNLEEDLGLLALSRGSSLRVRLLLRGGLLPPELIVSAQAETTPRYQRSLRMAAQEEALLPGLGAGRFRVTVWNRFTGQRLTSSLLAVDGIHDATLDVNLR
ncbi:MAG: hypothetical protein HC813_00060 [Planctomycetes bacterium]|nr:hypothetical protein [Planctomycetota bacterium]